MRNIFNYIDRPSPIHDLTGATKLVCLLLWSFAAMMTYDTRLLAVLPVISTASTQSPRQYMAMGSPTQKRPSLTVKKGTWLSMYFS